MFAGSPGGDSVWLFSLDGTLGPSERPESLQAKAVTVSVKDADTAAGAQVFAHVCWLVTATKGGVVTVVARISRV